mmetsp:Transcript_11147/g.32994  ORF Transcript_11147/g.32994 Transcript_11147/m.32994 type:complete len:201 (-) Transcript_11147:115-717(-)
MPRREFHLWRLAFLAALASFMSWAMSSGSLRAAFTRAAANSCMVVGGLSTPPRRCWRPTTCWSSSSFRSASRASRSRRAATSASVSSIWRRMRLPEMTERMTSSLDEERCLFFLCLSLCFPRLLLSFTLFLSLSLCLLCFRSLLLFRRCLSLPLSLSLSLSLCFLRRLDEDVDDDDDDGDDDGDDDDPDGDGIGGYRVVY